ncbi:AMP-binding protein, partial [Micromonospora sp. DT68]|uniref:AMP-binding protein n=1 Tax=Micromonospora sp. DT68 TaxID=3416522 RepID=UPI003CF0D3F3
TAQRFLTTWPHIELHNLYGPTEASIEVTAWQCEPDSTTVPIGQPIANTRIYVLDNLLRPTPIGIPGELHIAGTGLAHGYHNRPGLTARSFLTDPHDHRPGQRMYASGDLARWRTDGAIEYLGRTDRQVKLRGQRVELGEIEHTIAQHPDVRQCTVQLYNEAQLVAYLTGHPDLNHLRRHLADRLPT